MSRVLRRLAVLGVLVGVVAGPWQAASANGPVILGAGSTWSQVQISQWQSDVTRLGIGVNYQGVGSTQGRALFAGGTIDFGVSEIPFQKGVDAVPNRHFAYLPIVAGGTSVMYNLKTASGEQIRNLKLSAANIALIFTGKITNWSDKRLQSDGNRGLPNLPIRVVVRSDGSGTSAQFTKYLHETVPSIWNPFTNACGISTPTDGISFYPYGRSGCLPNAIGASRSDGVANYIANPGLGNGAVGYVEAAYAISRHLPVVGLKNKASNYALPTASNVATALQHATLNTDSTQELGKVYTAPEAYAYPMSSYSYMIVPTDGIDPSKGAVLGQFINYFACTGQQSSERLGYSPMPKRLVQFAFAAEKKIPGAPAPPALTASACANPTITGAFKLNATAANNVLPWTDLNQRFSGGSSSVNDPTQTNVNDPTQITENPNQESVGPTVNGPGPDDNSSLPGQAGYATNVPVLDPRSIAPLRHAAAAEIATLDDPGRMPLVIASAVILAVVFAPLALRFRR